MTVGSGDRLIQRPVTDLTRTQFSGGTTEFLQAYDDVELPPTRAATEGLNNAVFPSQFSGDTADFLADFDQVGLSPLSEELKGQQHEMHTWPLSRALPEVSFRSRLRRMASSLFSIGSGLSHRSHGSYYAGRPSDFTEYTAAQQTHLFGPPDETAALDTQQPDSLPFARLATNSPLQADTAESSLTMREKQVSSAGAVKQKTGNVLRANSRKLMVLGALALTVVGMGLFTSGGGGAESGNHKATAAASALPNRPIDDYNFMIGFTPHTRLASPIAEKARDLSAPDGAVTVSAAPTESGATKLKSDSAPAVLPTSAEPIILARGDSLWDKVSERVEATGISGDCELTNRTAQVVATLRAINPTKNLDVLSTGEHDLGFSRDILQQVLADSSAC